jgi:high-affinity iron transporter
MWRRLAAIVVLSVGIWMQGKSQAALHPRQALACFSLLGIVPVPAVFRRGLSRGVRDDPVLCCPVDQRLGLGRAGRRRQCCPRACGYRLADAAFSRELSIGRFFAFSAALVAILAVVLAGKGVAALREVGMTAMAPLHAFPRIKILGLYPTMQRAAAQVLTIGVLVAGFLFNQRAVARGLGRPADGHVLAVYRRPGERSRRGDERSLATGR